MSPDWFFSYWISVDMSNSVSNRLDTGNSLHQSHVRSTYHIIGVKGNVNMCGKSPPLYVLASICWNVGAAIFHVNAQFLSTSVGRSWALKWKFPSPRAPYSGSILFSFPSARTFDHSLNRVKQQVKVVQNVAVISSSAK